MLTWFAVVVSVGLGSGAFCDLPLTYIHMFNFQRRMFFSGLSGTAPSNFGSLTWFLPYSRGVDLFDLGGHVACLVFTPTCLSFLMQGVFTGCVFGA